MNFIKTIYNKVKQSHDEFWAEYEGTLQYEYISTKGEYTWQQ